MPTFLVSQGVRAARPVILAILGLLTLLAWSVASPSGSSPDDDFHATSIWCGWGIDADTCATTGVAGQRAVPFNPNDVSCYNFRPKESADCQVDFPDQSSRTVVDRGNFTGLYPPVYYGVTRVFVGEDFDDSILRIRVANSVLAVAMIGLLAFLVPAGLRRPMLWAFLATSVPLGLFVVGSINPSGWSFVSAGTLWIAFYAAFAATRWRRWGLGIFSAAALLMGAGSRGDACMYSCLAVVVVFILRWGVLRANRWLTILGLAMMAVAMAFFLGSEQSGVAAGGLNAAPDELSSASPLALTIDNLLNLPHLLTGMFGSWALGWFDTHLPPVVFQGALLVFAALLFLGLSHTTARKTIAVSLVALTLVAFPLVVLLQSSQTVGDGVQPRYLLPLVVMLLGVALLPAGTGRDVRLSRPQIVVVVAALGIAQAVALHTNIRRYVTGADVDGWNLNHAPEWWWDIPVQPMTVWIVGSLSFAVLCALVFRLPAPADPHIEPAETAETVTPSASDQPTATLPAPESPSHPMGHRSELETAPAQESS